MKKLENKVVFITGGLSGIGKACAILASEEGAIVIIADIENNKVNEVLTEINKEKNIVTFYSCDVSNMEQVKTTIEKVVSTHGRLDVALNNAGIGGNPNPIAQMTQTEWHNVMKVNLDGVFYCMHYELAQMEKQKSGVIINISSVLGKIGYASTAHYVAAKHAVIGLTQTAALEYATKGIRVNAICPGFILTPMLATNVGIVQQPQVTQSIIDKHPMARLGTPKEIAAGFLFLASDDSSFVSGTTLEIDGGYLAI